ncbi:MAG: hypothetical protein Q9227_008911 [Pyrenula ochraceoflavens]
MSHAVLPLSDKSLFKTQAYVNGKWVNARSGKTFEVTDPASNKVIGTMPEMSRDDTTTAIEAAAAAFSTFSRTTARERSRMLRKLYQLMTDNLDDLAKLITLENGKTLVEARDELVYSASHFEWFSEEACRAYGETIASSSADRRIYTIKQPIGICGLITPWNLPASMVSRKIGPAIAAGCTVILKSPGETPFTATALAELASRAGIPPGVFNVVTALQNTVEVGATLTSSPTVKKISFTGSTRVGKILMKQSADTLKKLSFELGGNAPFIVFDDADLDAAVQGAIANKFRSSGQTCVCANRIYVQRGVYNAFANALTNQVNSFKLGSGFSKDVTHGPLIHDRAISKVKEHIQDAINQGGVLLTGGHPLPNLGPNFFQPTVIRDVPNSALLAHEETFGPLAGLFPFDTEAEVLQLANDSEVGLAGYFFSKDVQRCHRVAEVLQVGMIGVNTGVVSDTALPFGGVKESGFGREGSKYGIEEYLTVKAVSLGGMGQPLVGS